MSNKNYKNTNNIIDKIIEVCKNKDFIHNDNLIKDEHILIDKNLKFIEKYYVANYILDLAIITLEKKIVNSHIKQNSTIKFNGKYYIHPEIIINSIFNTTKVLPLIILEYCNIIEVINCLHNNKSKIIDNAKNNIFVPDNLPIFLIKDVDIYKNNIKKISPEQNFLLTIYKVLQFLNIDNSKINNNVIFNLLKNLIIIIDMICL